MPRLVLVGGTHDGEEHDWIGPSLALPKKGQLEAQWVTAVAADAPPPPLDADTMEMYVVQTITSQRGQWQIYIEVSQRAEAVRHEQTASYLRERARDFAEEASRADCSAGVNRVFANWAYAAIIDAQIEEARASALYNPQPRPAEPPPPDVMH